MLSASMVAAILGAITVGAAIFALSTRRSVRLESRLGLLPGTIPTDREEHLARPFVQRVVLPLADWCRRLITRVLPSAVSADLERRLIIAGEPLTVSGFMAIELGAIGIAVAFGITVMALGLQTMILAALLAVAGGTIVGPILWLDSAGSARRAQVLKAMPDTVDLLVTMVEAGMSIDAALWRVAEETDGPLADELMFTMREMTLGRERGAALRGLAERCDVVELRSFVQAVVHAQKTGVPLGQVLAAQSEEIRLQKRQRAEAMAAKAPVKVLLIMLFFIMPSLLIVLLGPAFMRLRDVIQ